MPRTTEVRIGLGSCCLALGSDKVHEALCDAIDECGGDAYVKQIGCTGICSKVPLVELVSPDGASQIYTNVKPAMARKIVLKHFRPKGIFRPIRYAASRICDWVQSNEDPDSWKNTAAARDGVIASFIGPQKHLTLDLLDAIDPLDLDEYVRHGGFDALKKCLTQLEPQQILDEVEASGLRGRGGAGFPTHVKWRTVRAQESPTKYIICNGDEGDPGAFMDKVLLESIPFRVIEGMAIAARAVDAHDGIFYIRAEYPLAVERVRKAIEICEQGGILGDSVMGSEFSLKLEIREGAGAYICGEETALIHSIEGGRGTPRIRPPFPAESGLWEKPTLINNVETLFHDSLDTAKWRQGTCQVWDQNEQGHQGFCAGRKDPKRRPDRSADGNHDSSDRRGNRRWCGAGTHVQSRTDRRTLRRLRARRAGGYADRL